MTGNAWFTTPSPTLPTVTTDLNNLDAAESKALTKVKGAAEDRDSKKEIILKDARALLAYVQGVADNNLPNAETIIMSAGLSIKKKKMHVKGLLQTKQSQASGTILIIAKAAASRASYEWQMSPDMINWTNLPSTLQAKTSVSGLTPLKTYYFRYKAVLKKGESDWSTFVSAVVL